jgi:hypothetical protein
MHIEVTNAAATFGHVVLAVACMFLVVACTKLGSAATSKADRNKTDGQPRGWVL